MTLSKLLFITLLLISSTSLLYGQSNVPEGIYYQAVARNEAGSEMTNELLMLRITIEEEGTPVYTELMTPTTDDFGLFEVIIGNGEVLNGEFATIPWNAENYSLRVELDSGNGYELISITQLLTVPFSFYAARAYQAEIDLFEDADADPDNEAISSFVIDNEQIKISEGDSEFSIALSEISTDIDWTVEENQMISNSEVNLIGIHHPNPSSSLHINGSIGVSVESFSSEIGTNEITLTENNCVALCDVNAGNFSVNLPAASEVPGRLYFIKKFSGDSDIFLATNMVTINPSAGDKIDNVDSYNLNSVNFQEVTLVSDGDNWFVIAKSGN